MSETPPAPGWWRASDGNWYPPEAHPNAPRPSAWDPVATTTPATEPTVPTPPIVPTPLAPPTPTVPTPPAVESTGPVEGGGSKKWLAAVAIVVVLALIGGGVWFATRSDDEEPVRAASSTTTTERETTTTTEAPPLDLPEIHGAAGSDLDQITGAAIASLEDMWATALPANYDTELRPLRGGYWAVSPADTTPACLQIADEIAGNAFYCEIDDSIAWDDTELLPDAPRAVRRPRRRGGARARVRPRDPGAGRVRGPDRDPGGAGRLLRRRLGGHGGRLALGSGVRRRRPVDQQRARRLPATRRHAGDVRDRRQCARQRVRSRELVPGRLRRRRRQVRDLQRGQRLAGRAAVRPTRRTR